MSEIKRLLSRRERHKGSKDRVENSDNLLGLYDNGGTGRLRLSDRLSERDHEKKVKEVKDRLSRHGIKFDESAIGAVLKSQYVKGDTLKAFDRLMLHNDSVEGVIRPYDPKIEMLGAVNWNGVSCYLDSTLFSMFARLDSFEAMLYKDFDDPNRKNLATVIRIWVNTVRAGKLVEANIVRRLQECLSQCGWTDAANEEQQDASEAFSFITEKLDLPMLTLKVDLFHTGKEDLDDDHKFVRERLLEVAIPDDRPDGSVITLEDCLEAYFNSRVEVRRYLERRGTLNSVSGSGRQKSWDLNKIGATHVESVEVADSPGPSTPANQPPPPLPPYSPVRPGPMPLRQQSRQPSIIQESLVYDDKDEKAALKGLEKGGRGGRQRAMSIRKEVMMPAWQFFSLIPWYTDASPKSDAQIAAHFSSKRPVLGICLKRYLFTNAGQSVKRGTFIDIPIEIGLPHFIHDDNMTDNAPVFGNFKLSLQSIVCHRGDSVYSGHYISLVRGSWQDGEDKWMLFDDLASPRIKPVSIDRALREESPYLLFYQIQPIEGDPHDISRGERPPSYLSDARDSAIGDMSTVSLDRTGSSDAGTNGLSTGRPSLEEVDHSARFRGRTSTSRERRLSIAFTNPSTTSLSKTEDTNTSTGTGIARKDSRRSRRSAHSRTQSRATSQNGDPNNKRLSSTFQRFAGKITPLASKSSMDSTAVIIDEPSPQPLPPQQHQLQPPPGGQTEQSAYAQMRTDIAAAGLDPVMADRGKGKLKKEGREKSRDKSREKSREKSNGRANGYGAKIRKEARPDRECVIM